MIKLNRVDSSDNKTLRSATVYSSHSLLLCRRWTRHPRSEKYELAPTVFAAWRVDISLSYSGCRIEILKQLSRSAIEVKCQHNFITYIFHRRRRSLPSYIIFYLYFFTFTQIGRHTHTYTHTYTLTLEQTLVKTIPFTQHSWNGVYSSSGSAEAESPQPKLNSVHFGPQIWFKNDVVNCDIRKPLLIKFGEIVTIVGVCVPLTPHKWRPQAIAAARMRVLL